MIIETFMINFYGDGNTIQNFDQALNSEDYTAIEKMAFEIRKKKRG